MKKTNTKRKRTRKTAKKVSQVQQTNLQAEQPKSSGCLKGCIWGSVIILVLIILGGAIGIAKLFLSPGFIPFIIEEVFNKQISQDRGGGAGTQKQITGIKSGELSANLKIPEGLAQTITLTAADKSKWPKDAKGGMYQLEPSGSKFEKPLTINVNIKSDPGHRFSLGYFIPEKNDWQWIPTIKRAGNNYEARIEHASYVGTFTAKGSDITEQDYKLSENYQNDLLRQYYQQIDLLSVEADLNGYFDDRQGRWLRTRSLLEQLTNSVIKECKEEFSADRQRDFYFVWGLVQWNSFIGLDEFLKTFEESESRCMYKDESGTFNANYIIQEIDKYPYEVNVYNMAKSHGQQKSVYWGLPMKQPAWNRYGWQTEWKLIADVTTDALTDINIQVAPGSQAGVAVAGTTVDRLVMMFNLDGLSEGEKFPITIKSSGSYTIHSNSEYPKLMYLDKEGNPHFDNKYVDEYGLPTTFGPEEEKGRIKSEATATGILLRDLKEKGAQIKIEYEGLGKYQGAMDEVKKATEGTEFYNIFFQGGNLNVTMDIPPIDIKSADQYTSFPTTPPDTPYNNAPYN